MKHVLVVIFAGVLAACSQSTSPGPTSPSTTSATPTSTPAVTVAAADPLAAQIEQGKQLYVAQCAKCHGDGGQGTKDGPPVVGAGVFPRKARAGAKRDVEFKTAADVFAWTSRNMPADDPGSLSSEQLLAIFAFDLTANGVKLTQPLDGTQAAAIVLHP